MVGRRPNHPEGCMLTLMHRLKFKEGKYQKTYIQWNRRSLKRAVYGTGDFYANCVWGPFKTVEGIQGRGPYEMDLAFPESKLDIEVDGNNYHITPDQQARDQNRDKMLKANGWTVCRITAEQVYRVFAPLLSPGRLKK